jgi:DNA-binding NarL/FixJ family response regulator
MGNGRRRVLPVDDEPLVLDALARLLDLEFDVVTCPSARSNIFARRAVTR